MSDLTDTDNLFFDRAGMDLGQVESITKDALNKADDGELYLEYCQSEAVVFDDGQLKNASFNTSQGFGLRAVCDEVTGYSHASELNENAIKRAAKTVKSIYSGQSGTLSPPPTGTNSQLYVDDNPLSLIDFETKVKLLTDIDAYARAKDVRIAQVSASLSGSWQAIQVLRPDGFRAADIRPLVRLNVTVMVAQGDRLESGSYGAGGRVDYGEYLKQETWKETVDKALQLALINLESVPAPAGEMEVVLGSGWPGILLHEAIGHGLEGDFNRKKTSAFSGLLGERVAAPGVTVIDDGTISDRRGSLTIDDEGTPTQKTVLIEDGILKGYMQDRMNARLMGVQPTGNGRRQSYAHAPIPRMTNTYMPAGQHDPEEIIQSMGNGLYATNFGGGQVDITSGKFVFTCTEAYIVENGKIGAPVKGATLIGNGPDVLTRVSMIGNDFALDPGVGTCGKDGQGVPCGVGQPTIKVEKLTVGGTAA